MAILILDACTSFGCLEFLMSTALPDYLEPLSDGIHAIDTGFHRPRFDACYLIVERGSAWFVPVSTKAARPRSTIR